MSVSAGFFKQEQYESSNKKNSDKTIVDVGAHDLFRAVAAAFIDNLKQDIFLPERDLKRLIQHLTFYFPLIKKNESSPIETMRWLINTVRGAELIDCMASVLRALTVTAMLANPIRYVDAFQGLTKECTKRDLYQGVTLLPASVLHALTTIVPLTITLSMKEAGKEIPRQHIYVSPLNNASCFELTIQVQGQFYFPVIKNAPYFSSLTWLVKHIPEPIVTAESNSLDTVWQLLEEQEHSLETRYEHYVVILKNMVMDNELSKDKLITLYKEFLPDATNQQLFTYLAQKKQKKIIDAAIESIHERAVMLLINALAGGLSLGQIKEEQFFDALEQHNTVPMCL